MVRPVIFRLVSGKELCAQQLGQGEEEEEEAATEEEEEEREDARPEKDWAPVHPFPFSFRFARVWVNVVTGDYPKRRRERKLFIWENEFLAARIRFLLLHTRAGI